MITIVNKILLPCSYNISLSHTRVKVECVFGQMKRKFQCLTKCPDYDPSVMVTVIKACIFLWNYGLLCGDNKGYMPDDFPIQDQDELDARIAASVGGKAYQRHSM